MATTRGQLLDRIVYILGNSSTTFRTHIASCLDNMLFALYDMHDWEFKHKSATFNTVASTESYALNTAGVAPDIRSAKDIELIYDKTNGKFLIPDELRNIRKNYPKENNISQPNRFAAWGTKTIYLDPIPNGIFIIKFLYVAKPTLPTADANDLESVCSLPDYIHYLLEKMVLAEGMLGYDDTRRTSMLTEIQQLWLPNAIRADMRHLENNDRFKFWEEELSSSGGTFDDFIRSMFTSSRDY